MMQADALAKLIKRAQERDPVAFDLLVEAYGKRLYGYFFRLSGSRDDAEDLLQELFVRLVQMIGRYQHDGRFEGWLFRIAANLARDRIRRRKVTQVSLSRGSASLPAGDDPLARLADISAARPEDGLNRTELIDRLQQAISRLPDGEREVICLRHFSQLPFREVADVMGIPLGTALARAHRGLAHLREMMQE